MGGLPAADYQPVTRSGRAIFSFALPDDVAEIVSARLVLLPGADAEIAYQVRLALTQQQLPVS